LFRINRKFILFFLEAELMDRAERTSVLALLDKSSEQNEAAREALESEIGGLRNQVDKSAEETRQALNIAKYVFIMSVPLFTVLMGSELQAELARLRRFMREPSRALDDENNDNQADAELKRETGANNETGQEKESA
jgi:hypothetical protein